MPEEMMEQDMMGDVTPPTGRDGKPAFYQLSPEDIKPGQFKDELEMAVREGWITDANTGDPITAESYEAGGAAFRTRDLESIAEITGVSIEEALTEKTGAPVMEGDIYSTGEDSGGEIMGEEMNEGEMGMMDEGMMGEAEMEEEPLIGTPGSQVPDIGRFPGDVVARILQANNLPASEAEYMSEEEIEELAEKAGGIETFMDLIG